MDLFEKAQKAMSTERVQSNAYLSGVELKEKLPFSLTEENGELKFHLGAISMSMRTFQYIKVLTEGTKVTSEWSDDLVKDTKIKIVDELVAEDKITLEEGLKFQCIAKVKMRNKFDGKQMLVDHCYNGYVEYLDAMDDISEQRKSLSEDEVGRLRRTARRNLITSGVKNEEDYENEALHKFTPVFKTI